MVRITPENEHTIDISPALQRGVWLELPIAATVSDFARAVLNIDEGAFKREVGTIILNNQMVDDPGNTELHPGDCLVLSGAMPGLVGAMLRSSSPIKILRSGITGVGADGRAGRPDRLVRVKFFNTILKNHRRNILAYGFFLDE